MRNINIVYDDEFDHVSIFAIPDDVVPDIESLSQEYLHWIPPLDDPDGWVVIRGKTYMSKEVRGFVKWLNEKCCRGLAYVVERDTIYRPEYPMVEF